MGIEKGLINQNHRYDSIDEAYIYERIDAPGEEHIAVLLQGLGGRVGFVLTEIPVLDSIRPTVVTRYNIDLSTDNFDETNIAPSTQQFKINYNQEDSIVYLPITEIGNKFKVEYTCKGTANNAENTTSLMRSAIEFNTGLSGKFKQSNSYDKIINGTNVYLLGKRATVRNCLIQGSNVIRGNVYGLTSFFEVYGDLTLERGSVIDTAGVIFIVHGSINVTGTGANPIFKGVDFVAGNAGAAGSMGGYTQMGGNGGGGGSGGKILESTGEDVGGDGGGGGGGGGFGWDAFIGVVGYGGIGVHGGANGADGTDGFVSFVGYGGAGGAGGSANDGGAGSILFGAGGDAETGGAGGSGTNTDGSTGPLYTSGAGGAGGAGGASGGAGLIIICFGDIDSRIDFVSGKGTAGSQSGPITIMSKYTSLPNVLDVAGGAGGGIDGVLSLIDVSNRSDINEHYLNQFGYFSAGSISI